MPTAIIADDEDLQRRLALAWPELAIVASCEDGSDALDLGAIDYLLKPVTETRLALQAMADPDRRLRVTVQQARIRWLNATLGNTIKMFAIDEVLFFESDTRYTRIVSADDQGVIRKPLKELREGLDPDQFWQSHRSTLVAVRAIARARRDELGNITVELRNHSAQLKVSQTYAWRFRSEVLLG